MTRRSTEYLVIQRSNRWFVDVGTEHYGPYLSQRDAIADAVHAANETGSHSNRAVVLVKPSRGDAERIWTFGKDEYPPDGYVAAAQLGT